MANEVLLASQFVAAGAMLALAGWLLWLNARSTVNRSFAVFLVVRAAVILANRMRGLAEDAGHAGSALFWQSIREYYNLALIPALLYFFVAYKRSRRRTLLRAGIVFLAVVVELLYLLDHCLNQCTLADGRNRLGPLNLVANPGFGPVMGIVGLAILHESLRSQAPRQRAAFPVAVGLLLSPLLDVTFSVGQAARFGLQQTVAAFEPSFWASIGNFVFFLGALPPALGLAGAVSAAVRTPALRPNARFLLVCAALIAGSGFYAGWNAVVPNWLPGIFLLGLWRILLPAMVAYALVRHRLFDADIRLKWTLVRAILAFTFLGVFFVVAQLAQNYLSAAYGWGVGGAVAGLLLFVISPLQRMAERFTQTVLPHAQPVASLAHPERLDLFRHQAVLVWSDGAMGRKERSLLDQLRDRLGLGYEDAARIEAEAAALAPPSPSFLLEAARGPPI